MHSSTVVRIVFIAHLRFYLKSAPIKWSLKINLNVNIASLKENKDLQKWLEGARPSQALDGRYCSVFDFDDKTEATVTEAWLLRQHKRSPDNSNHKQSAPCKVVLCQARSQSKSSQAFVLLVSLVVCNIICYYLKTVTHYPPSLLPCDTNPA